MMFLVIWIGFEDLDLIGFDSLQVDWIWIWIVASRDWIDSKNLDWIFGFFQSLKRAPKRPEQREEPA